MVTTNPAPTWPSRQVKREAAQLLHDVENHLKQNNMAAIESMLPRVKKLNLDDEAVNKLASRWGC